MHPHWLRYFSFEYSRHAHSSPFDELRATLSHVEASRLASGRLAALGATPGFHHELLRAGDESFDVACSRAAACRARAGEVGQRRPLDAT